METFEEVYKTKRWGFRNKQRSGPGSTIDATRNIRNFLDDFVEKNHIKTILDVSCGDMNWQKVWLKGKPSVEFTGSDISTTVIEDNKKRYPQYQFVQKDITREEIEGEYDLIICRHTMPHLKTEANKQLLKNIFSKAKYIGLTTSRHVKVNPVDKTREPLIKDLDTGFRWQEVNLEIQPFNLPSPISYTRDVNPKQLFAIFTGKV